MQVRTFGAGPRVLLVHGSLTGGEPTWSRQAPLAERFRLDVVERPGFAPGDAPPERVDFERDAALLAGLLREPAHVVGHSYGGVVALLAAAAEPDAVRSLSVLEPPALALARGVPAVEAFVTATAALWADAPEEPEAFARRFAALVGGRLPSGTLAPPLLRGAALLRRERPPWEAEIPLAALRRAPFAKLVVSGAHHAAFDAVCDVLERELPAERAVLPGAGHAVQRAPGFNELLAAFLARAATPRAGEVTR